ncbi:MAG: hypothetical protein ACRDTD_33760 [Pseudonocardiaceae bacterium]
MRTRSTLRRLGSAVAVAVMALGLTAVAAGSASAYAVAPAEVEAEFPLEAEAELAAASCKRIFTTIPGKWVEDRSRCAKLGGDYAVVRWHTVGNQQACVNGRSYTGRWVRLGCGKSGGGRIPWGGQAGNPRVSAISTTFTIAQVHWEH